jgi:tetratricopeptide (TPR) repeat protein
MQRQGRKEFNRDRFELFRDYAASGEIIYNNSLSDALYTSAVVAALNVSEFDWAERFNEEFRPRLESSIRQDAYYYNIARILHARGKNEEALKYLARVISTHHPIKAVVKVIELQILYELNDIDTTELKLDSLRHFFTRNEEMNNSMRESLKNFHRTYSMLFKVKSGEGKHTAAEIRKFLSGKRQSFSMEWLKEKIEELESRKSKK